MASSSKDHSFRNYFTLVKNNRNKSNAIAVCKFCAEEYGEVQAALLVEGAHTSNKRNLCRNHLAKCENFKSKYNPDEQNEILSLPVAEDKKRKIDTTDSLADPLLISNKRQNSSSMELVQKLVTETKCLHIGSPIISNDRSESSNKNNNEVEVNNSYNDENYSDDDLEVLASEDEDFFEGERENQFDNIEDEDLLSAEFDDDFDLAGRNFYPADDINAKWTLESLMINNLETPLFLGSNYIFSDAK
ncbi:19537_t:CDS:2 [Gigaspora margarita]|uniref:19537_t:CDS:1 n=1 Tax=Gigaspora margarita TaxID=4874 RepID=A0ABN7W5M7_GIGMA|nr:19537_t:CDS:2 [Gigaspora margarita]